MSCRFRSSAATATLASLFKLLNVKFFVIEVYQICLKMHLKQLGFSKGSRIGSCLKRRWVFGKKLDVLNICNGGKVAVECVPIGIVS